MDGADWLRTQLTSFGCAACGQAYETGRIRVLAERDGLFFVDLACVHCGSQAVAIVTVQAEDDEPQADAGELLPASSPGVRLHAGGHPLPPVSADDVIEMHDLLAGFEGDVTELLERLGADVQPGSR